MRQQQRQFDFQMDQQQRQSDFQMQRQSKFDDADILERKANIAMRNMQAMKEQELQQLREQNRSEEEKARTAAEVRYTIFFRVFCPSVTEGKVCLK